MSRADLKTCTRCGQVRTVEAFPTRKNGRLHGWCGPCLREYSQDRRDKRAAASTRICPGCDKELPAGLRRDATTCNRACYMAWWQRRHKPRVKGFERRRMLKRNYGLTEYDYAVMRDNQDGFCAICRQVPDPDHGYGKLVVDHDHATGVIRGLLCDPCNQGLGRFRDRPDVLMKAVRYLGGDPSVFAQPGAEDFRG